MAADDIETCALTTAVGLLDALIDAASAAVPGVTADLYARDLRALGDGASQAAADLQSLPRRRRRALKAA